MTSLASNHDSPRSERLWSRVGWGLVVLGWVFALGRYVARLGLRYDESRVTLNLLERNYVELLQPLDYQQGAPVGFLWVHKAMIDWVSFSEWGLRLPTLIAGLLIPCLIWDAARRLANPMAGALAVLMVIFHREIGLYVPEVKQYAFDCATTAGLLWAWSLLPEGRLSFRIWVGLGLMGLVLPWLSHAALFGLAGFGLALLWRTVAAKGDKGEVAKVMGIGALWFFGVAALYVLQLHTLAEEEWAKVWWAKHFAPLPFSNGWSLWWGRRIVSQFLFGTNWGIYLFPLYLTGLWVFWRRNPATVVLLVVPMIVTWIASSFEAYPFYGRLLLFSLPLAGLPLGAGAAAWWRAWSQWKVVHWGLRIAVTLWVLVLVKEGVRARSGDHNNMIDARPLFEHVDREQRSGDAVWMSSELDFSARVYSRMLNLDSATWIQGGAWVKADTQEVAQELAHIDTPRIWVLTNRPRGDEEWVQNLGHALRPDRKATVVLVTRSTVLLSLE